MIGPLAKPLPCGMVWPLFIIVVVVKDELIHFNVLTPPKVQGKDAMGKYPYSCVYDLEHVTPHKYPMVPVQGC